MAGAETESIGLSTVVDILDQVDLFEYLGNEDVLLLSQLRGEGGFSGIKNVRKSTGIRQRRILRRGVTSADLAIRLCERLQDAAGCELRDFHAVFLCHSHTDPDACRAIANILEQRFLLDPGHVLPFNFGCTGFLKLLQEGILEFAAAPPDARLAVLTVETPESWHDASDRLFCGLVSSGAVAAVLEADGRFPLHRVVADDFVVPTFRRPNADPLFWTDSGDVFSFRGEPRHRTVMRMNPESVFINAIEMMLDSLRAALSMIPVKEGDRVIAIPHQPSGKLLRALIAAGQMEFPHVEFLNNLPDYGNMISAAVPAVLSRLDSVLEQNGYAPLREGDHLLMLAAGICMTDIADRMSAGYAHLEWAPALAPLSAAKQIASSV